MRSRMRPHDFSIADYTLLTGPFELRSLERSMLTTLAIPHETLGAFVERLGADELSFEVVALYVDEGAFEDPVYYPALANLRRAHPDAGSLVRRTRDAFRRRVNSNASMREEALYADRLDTGDPDAILRQNEATAAYVDSLTREQRARFDELTQASGKQHL